MPYVQSWSWEEDSSCRACPPRASMRRPVTPRINRVGGPQPMRSRPHSQTCARARTRAGVCAHPQPGTQPGHTPRPHAHCAKELWCCSPGARHAPAQVRAPTRSQACARARAGAGMRARLRVLQPQPCPALHTAGDAAPALSSSSPWLNQLNPQTDWRTPCAFMSFCAHARTRPYACTSSHMRHACVPLLPRRLALAGPARGHSVGIPVTGS